MHAQQSALKNPIVVVIARRRVGRGGGGGDDTTDDDDNDKDHNNNTTIKQCTGERGADDDGSDWQLAVGDVEDNRRQQRQALEGKTMVEVSGNVSGMAVANGSKQQRRTRAVEESGRRRIFVGCKKSISH